MSQHRITELCGCGCETPLPEEMRYGALYLNRAHKQRMTRKRASEKVAGYVDLCGYCGHPEEFHTMKPWEDGAEVQEKLVWDPIDLLCSQINCQCMGYEPLPEIAKHELVTS